MSYTAEGSVTRRIQSLKHGDHDAAQFLWDRYYARLVHLARNRLRSAPRLGAASDEEDAALSAFDSFCAAIEGGRFPQLRGRDELCRLLAKIVVRKAWERCMS